MTAPDDIKTFTLEDLVGIKVLDARGEYVAKAGPDDYHDSQFVMLLRLDGVVYAFQEDENDGYRSCLGEVRVEEDEDNLAFLAVFPPMVVTLRTRDKGNSGWGGSDPAHVLYAIDERTGLVVFEVGTENTDDYYPSYLASWTPEGNSPEWLHAAATD